jgi:hypothetical protein
MDINDDEALALVLLIIAKRIRDRKKEPRPRRHWVKPWIRRRIEHGAYHNLLRELELEDPSDFRAFLRMEPRMFHEIVARVGPRVTKQDTRYRKALSPGLKIAITLRFLATGNSFRSERFNFRTPHNTISKFFPAVCEAIIDEFSDLTGLPNTSEDWKIKSEEFRSRWNLPHCLGAIDGKHIAIKRPRLSSTLYHNYKGFFSIILLAVVDADYKFIWAVVGANGSTSDCAVFNASDLKEGFENNEYNIPEPDDLPGTDMPFPYFLVGDDAFPLLNWMLKPFSTRALTEEQRIYNYRISRARRIVENGFGILASRFRCLLTTLQVIPETVSSLTLACICLHNLMRIRYPGMQNADLDRETPEHTVIPGEWRTDSLMQDLADTRGATRAAKEYKENRIKMMHYLNGIGSVPWQWDMV